MKWAGFVVEGDVKGILNPTASGEIARGRRRWVTEIICWVDLMEIFENGCWGIGEERRKDGGVEEE